MNHCVEPCLLAPAFPVQAPGAPFPITRLHAAGRPTSFAPPSEVLLRNGTRASAPRMLEAASIFMVDDTEGITDLYQNFLSETGYATRVFNSRAEALAGLTADKNKPDLLIMDYFGDAMPVDRFIQRCRVVHPALRILMASGLSPGETRFSCVRPDRFIRKPFTAEEFRDEVRAALASW